MLKIRLSKKAEKFLRNLTEKHFLQIDRKLTELSKNPKPNDSLQLKGLKNFHRVDVGEYRVIYKTDENHLIVDVIGKRNDSDVYKRFFRKKR